MRRGYFLNFIIMQTEKQKKRWTFRWLFWSFSVVFGRFSGHSRSFPVIFRLVPIDSGKSFLFIPFHSFSFLIPPQNHGK